MKQTKMIPTVCSVAKVVRTTLKRQMENHKTKGRRTSDEEYMML
jgi:hypothetical protein